MFRNVPKSDLELLLPHIQVRMPEFQRNQFTLFGGLGLLAGYPLLSEDSLSYNHLVRFSV